MPRRCAPNVSDAEQKHDRDGQLADQNAVDADVAVRGLAEGQVEGRPTTPRMPFDSPRAAWRSSAQSAGLSVSALKAEMQDRDGDGERELLVEAARDAAHEGDGNEDRRRG